MSDHARTVLFTDMEASTEFSVKRGDADAVALMHVHERAVSGPVDRHAGIVVKNTGDGFLAVFPSSEQGVRAALGIRARIGDHNRSNPETPLRVRLGLHTGRVIEEDGDVFGLTVSTAARVTSKASAGQVLVSEPVRLEADGGDEWSYVDRGSFWLKGLHEKWQLHEAVPAGESPLASSAREDQVGFVGRDAERAELRRSVDAADSGHGSLVVVTGSAGCGKTRLVEEIGAEAAARGMRFVVGRCHDAGQSEPYTAWVDVAEAAERALSPDAFRDVLGPSAGEMARLLPHLRNRYPDIGPASDTGGAETRRYFFTNVREVLARLAARRPLVVLLDDLQWADVPTLLLLEHLAGELTDLPILLVATYTLEEVSSSTPLHATLARLHQRQAVETIRLESLTRVDIADLLGAAGAGEPPLSLVDAVHERTEGNAFFAGELVRQLVEGGAIADSGWNPDFTLSDLAVPEGVRLVIESRFEKLEPATRKLLGLASLLGRDFSLELLEALADISEDELLDAIDEAERVSLIVSTVQAASVRFAFQHEMIRQTLLDQISHSRLQRLHGRIAAALEEVYADSLPTHAATISSHLEQAGASVEPERKLRFHALAGERALDSAAFEDALPHFRRVLEMTPNTDARARAAVFERLATAERSLGNLEDALAVWDDALDAYEAAGDVDSVGRTALAAALQVAWWRRGSDVGRLVRRGLAALGDEQSATRAGLLAVAGMLDSQMGHHDVGQELLDEALALAREQQDDRIIGVTLYAATAHDFAYQQFRETIEVGVESIEYLREAGDFWDLANVLGYVGAANGWLGRFEEAAEFGREGEALALRLGNWSAFVFAEQARAFRDAGSNPSASVLEERGRRALELGEDMGFTWLASVGHARIGLATFWRGDWREALDQFEAAADIEVRGATGGHLGQLMLVHAYLGDRSAALDLASRARADFPVPGRPTSMTSVGLAATAIEVFTMLGERDQAAALAATLDELAATGVMMRGWDFRLVATLQGMASTCAGDWDRAEGRFEKALQASRTLPMRREEPEACRFYAQMLDERNRVGDRDRARELRERATEGYEEFGMPAHAALVRDRG
ncbi:MAG TPA: AAA family ATPase [Acidimicrobiales bacterium]|nr:AAA family ATPase [Acidimicrobiales bacterium]